MSTHTSTEHYDVVVVGARVAGSSTARLLAGLGHDVLVLDRAELPSDTVSTHSLARGGVVQLARWGLLDRVLETGAPAIREVSFWTRESGLFTNVVKDRAGVDLLLAPRRTALDAVLLDAARGAGAEVRTGWTVTDVERDAEGRVVGVRALDADRREHRVLASLVVGADGMRSRIAQSVGAQTLEDRPADGAARYTYVEGLDAPGSEFHLADGAMVGVFPTHGGQHNLWVCGPSRTLAPIRGRAIADHFDEFIATHAPDLAHRLRSATRLAPVAGMGHMPNLLRQASGPGWALVGDAGYFRDAVTGHGMTDAMRDAELLARAVDLGLRSHCLEVALAEYQAARDRMVAGLFDLTARLAHYPTVPVFADLQRDFGRRVGQEAEELAGWPDLLESEGVLVS